MARALDSLLAAAQALPGGPDLAAAAALPRGLDVDVGVAPMLAGPQGGAELRARLAALLDELGQRLQTRLPEVLRLAARAWDQVDTLAVLDHALAAEARGLRGAAARRAVDDTLAAPARAEARLALVTLDAVVGLVSMLERRLASLARLQLRAEAPLVDADGRAFLDLGSALRETAHSWRRA